LAFYADLLANLKMIATKVKVIGEKKVRELRKIAKKRRVDRIRELKWRLNYIG